MGNVNAASRIVIACFVRRVKGAPSSKTQNTITLPLFHLVFGG